MNKVLVWILFVVLTLMQAMGNTYYAYTHIHDFQYWSELFGLIEEDVIYQKRLLSLISGAILPLVSLGFIKSLVDYIRPDKDTSNIEEKSVIVEIPLETNKEISSENLDEMKEIDLTQEQLNSVNYGRLGYIPRDLDPTKIT